ncbi:hypothetical protein CEXT_603451 [Caerostris extrusa]|uniref:Uncharacterized protein n=1 Tax=Caerostris extrusa TaxID=172846 RepID=A0AAV4PWR2_CAEEX|nr:hypothetical protein CEXT_603451 [Caerostris extrusa]
MKGDCCGSCFTHHPLKQPKDAKAFPDQNDPPRYPSTVLKRDSYPTVKQLLLLPPPLDIAEQHLGCETEIVKRYFLRSFFHLLLLLLLILLIHTAMQTPPHQVKCPLAPFVLELWMSSFNVLSLSPLCRCILEFRLRLTGLDCAWPAVLYYVSISLRIFPVNF